MRRLLRNLPVLVFLVSKLIRIPAITHKVGGLHHNYAGVGTNSGRRLLLPHPRRRVWLTDHLALVAQRVFFAASPSGEEGFTAQKFMAAKNEFYAQVGQLFNAFLSLVVRVLPFILLGLVATAVFPPEAVKGELA